MTINDHYKAFLPTPLISGHFQVLFFLLFWPFSAVSDPGRVCLMTYFLHYYTSDYFWPIQSISSHFLLHPAISGHFSAIFWLFLAIFGHLWPLLVTMTTSSTSDDHFFPLLSISGLFRAFPATFNHIQPFLSIFGHFQLFLAIFSYLWPILTTTNQLMHFWWPFLATTDHFRTL